MVIVGSALIIFGAELNTPFTTVEVFRKILRKEANGWDVSALVVSLIGTVVNLLVTFASRLSLDTAWKGLVLNWGPLLSGFAVACDYYGALVELGFLFGSYEVRMDNWLEQRQAYNERHGIEHKDPLPAARIEQYRVVVARHNGGGPLNAEQLESELQADGYGLPSPSTVGRWLRMGEQ
jgi:hypothetical protein